MYRHQSATAPLGPLPWFRRPHGRILSFSVVALGTIYYTGRRIYADEPHKNPVGFETAFSSGEPSTPAAEDEAFVKTKLWHFSAIGTIMGDAGISRFDVISIPNVNPRQDTSLLSSCRMASGTSWTLFTLYDGYDGWENAGAVSMRLATALMNGLNAVFTKYEPAAEHTEVGMVPTEELDMEPFEVAINRKIKDIFVDVDDSIVHRPFDFKSAARSQSSVSAALGAALFGSSAILAFYDSEPRKLRVALTGNARAVLGRRAPPKNGQMSYEVHVLTADQTCSNPTEVARLHSQHPDESLCSEGHVLGCELTRAFGLAAYKWSREMQERLHREFSGDSPLASAKSPPYLTAEPEITTIEVRPGDFLVMASRGLWNSLTDEEVVGLVGLWLNRGMAVNTDTASLPADVISPGDLPVSLGTDNTVMYTRWRAEKKFLCVDNNAAGHLARNALGGANVGLTGALLAMEPPRSQRFRDGINMSVIFFDGDK